MKSKTLRSRTLRARRREALRRAWASHNPLTAHPPLRWWHGALLLGILSLSYVTIQAPGVLADLAGLRIADWEWFVRARSTVIILCAFALVGVRSYRPLIGAGMVLTIVGLSLRLGNNQLTQEPLTLGFALLLLALAVVPVRVIIRPNPDDLIVQYQERAETAEGELARCQRAETEATLRAEAAELALKMRSGA